MTTLFCLEERYIVPCPIVPYPLSKDNMLFLMPLHLGCAAAHHTAGSKNNLATCHALRGSSIFLHPPPFPSLLFWSPPRLRSAHLYGHQSPHALNSEHTKPGATPPRLPTHVCVCVCVCACLRAVCPLFPGGRPGPQGRVPRTILGTVPPAGGEPAAEGRDARAPAGDGAPHRARPRGAAQEGGRSCRWCFRWSCRWCYSRGE